MQKRDREATARKLEAYERLCKELGENPADVALAWLLANPVVTAPIIGPRTVEQLDGALRALEIRLRRTPPSGWTRSSPAPAARGAGGVRLVIRGGLPAAERSHAARRRARSFSMSRSP